MKPILKNPNTKKNKFSRIVLVTGFICLLLASIISSFFIGTPESRRPFVTRATLPGPQFSHASGFYNQSFLLTIQARPGAAIYYTLDGSAPDRFSNRYESPIEVTSRADAPNVLSEIRNSPVFFAPLETVFKGFIVRAVAVVNDSIAGKETVGSYFIHPQGRDKYELPVLSLVTDADNLFGYKKGIYVNGATTDDKDYYLKKNIDIGDYTEGFPTNYKRKGVRWERPVSLNFIGAGNSGFSVHGGIRIHGNATRERPQKSFNFYLNAYYGAPFLTYPLFGRESPAKVETFVIRNSGQDMYQSRMRDALAREILKNQTKVDLQAYRPAVLFINGEYWGIYDIRERIDEFYFQNKYGIPADSLVMLGAQLRVERGDSTDNQSFLNLVDIATNVDMRLPANYQKVASEMDINNFIDYVIAEIYFGNRDWPDNNISIWRYKASPGHNDSSVKDGRWRFALYDIDLGFGAQNSASYNMSRYLYNRKRLGQLFKGLLNNQAFQEKFFSRFEELLHTSFEANHVIGIIDAIEKELEPAMAEHINRWRTHRSVDAWKIEVQALRTFARQRPDYQRKELQELRAMLKVKQ